MNPLKNQHVLILGLGLSGLAMARWCARRGARVTVADTREAPPQLQALRDDLPQAEFISGPFNAALLQHGRPVQTVLKSPGLTPEAVAPVVTAANAQGLWARGELDLFSQALAELKEERGYAPRVLAVTGTNGKTTVTSLTGQLLARGGKKVAVAGNIGPTLLDTLQEKITADELPDAWVIELSSFQLYEASAFEPTAATVLNITQDHLDWHGSMQAYAAAKARVFGQKGLMLLNREDPLVMGFAAVAGPGEQRKKAAPLRPYATFGGDTPTRPGDYGIEVVNGMAWLVRAIEADETRKRKSDEVEEIFIQRLMPADALRIRGRHNAVNALAALALATAAGGALGPMLFALREYRGEAHRVEPVAIINGIEYFDDSKGTNVGATVAALNGLGAERKVVVILGGDGKGQDFAPLADPVARNARAAVLIGRDAPQIRAALESTGTRLLDAASMPEAVQLATRQAHEGDAVLMSPACASFDMFDNYGHRAQVFRDAVDALAQETGQMQGAAA